MGTALLLIQVATLVALILYVVKTWHMATATRRAAEASAATLNEMQATREAESRPYVAVFTQPYEVEPRAIDIVVHNYGRTAAHDIRVKFDPELRSSWPEVIENVVFLAEGIAFLPPGATMQTTFDVIPDESETGIPREYTATVVYTDERGAHRYEQVERLNVAQHRGVGTITAISRRPSRLPKTRHKRSPMWSGVSSTSLLASTGG